MEDIKVIHELDEYLNQRMGVMSIG